MKNHGHLFRRSSRGSAAVEMAIILPIFLLLLSVPLFYGRVFWYYSVAQKAAHDAARYMSSATQAEVRTSPTGFGEPNFVAVARWIAQQELMELTPLTDGMPIDISCDPSPCGGKVPKTVRITIGVKLHDSLLGPLTTEYIGNTNMMLVSDVTMVYVGQ